MHCGVGTGYVISYHVGGLHNRWEYTISGDPISQIAKAEKLAKAGEIIISRQCHELIRDHCDGVIVVENSKSQGYSNFNLKGINTPVEFRERKMFISDQVMEEYGCDSRSLSIIQSAMRCYVPRPVLLAIESGQSVLVAELRVCTTIFCKLTGCAFKVQKDLEVLQRSLFAIQEQLLNYEGTLCRFIIDDKGAGILMSFGLPPFMHENDPLRAVKAALEMYKAINVLGLSCSIGVTSGRVFCGTAGGKRRCEYTLHGTIVNLAARYMVAAKDGILCGEITAKEAMGNIEFAQPEMIKVKGREGEVAVYRPIKEKRHIQMRAKLKMFGRDGEAKRIQKLMESVVNASGEVGKGPFGCALIQAEAGLGKSRMCQDVYKNATALGMKVLVAATSDTEMGTPFYVWRALCSQIYMDIGGGALEGVNSKNTSMKTMKATMQKASAEENEKRRELIAEIVGADMKDLIPLLAPIFPEFIDGKDNDVTKQMKGEVRAANTMSILLQILKVYTKRQKRGVVISFEDMQWMDTNSALSVSNIASQAPDGVFIIITARRSEVRGEAEDELERISQIGSVHTFELSPLDFDSIRECMCMWLEADHVPDPAVNAVMAKSGGHPLFSEELTKLMRDTGALKKSRTENVYKLSKEAQSGQFDLPDSISKVMTSRLDRVTPSQQLVLKVAAVIGMTFQKGVLCSVLPNDEGRTFTQLRRQTDKDVKALVTAGFLDAEKGLVTVFRFKNAVLKEAAYNLLLFEQRRDVHMGIAKYYEERNKEYLEPVYFILADNYYKAEAWGLAVEYLELAGDDALDNHAMKRVWECFSRLLGLDVPETKVKLERKASWYRKAGEALMHLEKFPDAFQYLGDALGLLELEISDLPERTQGGCCQKKTPVLRSVTSLPSYTRIKAGKGYSRFLEACTIYRLLGAMDRDRRSHQALEYRVNGVKLGEESVAPGSNMPSELALAYAILGIYYSTRNDDAGAQFIKKAVAASKTIDSSETQAIVNRLVSEYMIGQGNWKNSSAFLKKASWVCNFLNFDRMIEKCAALEITTNCFRGKFTGSSKLISDMKNPSRKILGLGARCAALEGDAASAIVFLERAAGVKAGTFKTQYERVAGALWDNANACLALAMLELYEMGEHDKALAGVNMCAHILSVTKHNHLPLSGFHAIALSFDVCLEALQGRVLKQIDIDEPDEGKSISLNTKQRSSHAMSSSAKVAPSDIDTYVSMRSLLNIINEYSKTYPPCRPHTTYCTALFKEMTTGNVSVDLLQSAQKDGEAYDTPFVVALAKLRLGEHKEDNELLGEAASVFKKAGAFQHSTYVDGILSGSSQRSSKRHSKKKSSLSGSFRRFKSKQVAPAS